MVKLVWHLVAHTLGSLKSFAWTWLGILAFQTWALWMGPDDPTLPRAPGLDLANAGLVLRIVLTVVLAALVVFRQPLVGTTAFWRSRPIPRSALLLSTLATVALILVLVPFVWFFAVSVWFGLDCGTALQAALIIAAEQIAAAGLALAVASVTRNLAQGIVVSIAIAAGTWIAIVLLHVPVSLPPRHGTLLTLRSGEWVPTIVLTLVGLVAAAVSAHQHLTLRTRQTCLLIGGLVLLPSLFARFPLWSVRSFVAGPPVSRAIAIPELELDPESMQSEPYVRIDPGHRPINGTRYTALLRASGPGAESVMLMPQSLQATLRFDNGVEETYASDSVELTTERDPVPESSTHGLQPLSSLAAAIGGAFIAEPTSHLQRRYRMLFFERPGLIAGSARGQATAIVRVVCEAYRYTIVARTRLAARSWLRTPGLVAEIESVTHAAEEVSLTLRETHKSLRHEERQDVFLLFNQRQAEAVLFAQLGSSVSRSTFVANDGLVVTRLALSATTPGKPGSRPVFDEGWLAGAELLLLTREDLGRVERNLRLSGLFVERRPAADGGER
jgi:hypothetical protein